MIEKIHKLSPSSINTNIVNVEDTLMSCLKSLENSEYKFLVVKEGEIVKGVITDGDIRRYLFSTSNLNTPIKNVINEKFYFVNKETSILKIREIMNKQDVKFLLFLDKDTKLKGVYLAKPEKIQTIPNACLIQAGGFGTRLGNLTKNKPKALIEVEGTALIDLQIQKLYEQGFRNIFISIHHLKEKIIRHIDKNIEFSDLNISFITEDKPLGTFGSVVSMKNESEPFLVKNCDVLDEIDYKNFMKSFNKKNTLIRVGLTNYEVQIPFGVANVDKRNVITFDEKPIKNYLINTGIYMVNPIFLKSIRKNVKLDFDEFLNKYGNLGSVESKLIMTHWFDIGTRDNLNSARKFYSS